MNDQPASPGNSEFNQQPLTANPAVAKVDSFVRARPYFTALCAFGVGFAVAHSIAECRTGGSSSRTTQDILDELKSAIGHIAARVEESAGDASGHFSAAIGKALKKSRSLF